MRSRSWLYCTCLAGGLWLTGCGDDSEEQPALSDGGVEDAGEGSAAAVAHPDAEDRDAAGDDRGEDGDSDGGDDLEMADAAVGSADDASESETPVVEVSGGRLAGVNQGGSFAYLGVPYAAPPLGELRFAAPEPAEPWEGVRQATEFGGRCAQLESTTLQNAASDNEDCLYLNVWTPEIEPESPKPVMVWIHGGGNVNGSASEPVPYADAGLFYSGQFLAAENDVVVVTLNYRLGRFGFVLEPELGLVGNQGLWDQRAALQWVADNIAAFGGDPERVTIFGESAGAQDVCLHVASPESRGLFQRAISQSGGCTTLAPTGEQAAFSTQGLITALGCAEAEDSVACLREQTVDDILNAVIDTPGVSFGPVVDGSFVPEQPRALYDAGAIADVPYLLGSNSDEGTLFVTNLMISDETAYQASLTAAFGDFATEVAMRYPYADYSSASSPGNAAFARVLGDSRLVCTTYDVGDRAATAGRQVFAYNFAIPTSVGMDLGATHGAELAYVFGTGTTFSEAEMEASALIRRYWSRFAATGDPNGDDDLQWPQFSGATPARVNFNADGAETLPDFRAELCRFWQQRYATQF